MEPEPTKQTAIEFAKNKLSINPEATFAEIKAQAKIEGLVVYPVVYGRAKALLGLVPTAPYGSKSKARQNRDSTPLPRARPEPAPPAPATTAPVDPLLPREPVNGDRGVTNGSSNRTERARADADEAAGGVMSSLETMITDLRTAVQERDRYRAVLQHIADMIRVELAK